MARERQRGEVSAFFGSVVLAVYPCIQRHPYATPILDTRITRAHVHARTHKHTPPRIKHTNTRAHTHKHAHMHTHAHTSYVVHDTHTAPCDERRLMIYRSSLRPSGSAGIACMALRDSYIRDSYIRDSDILQP